MSARGQIAFEVDVATGSVRVGVLPSPFALESARAWATMPIPEFQDMAANITLGVNQAFREMAAQLRANGGAQSNGARPF